MMNEIMTKPSDPRDKARAVFLAALMVFSVLRDTIGAVGEAATAELSAGATPGAAGRAETADDDVPSGNDQPTEVMV
jgi:surface glycoprotein (TIGR04207 family)